MDFESNIKILLDKNADLSQISFLGLKLGDDISKLEKDLITEVNAYETRWIRTNKHIHFRTETGNSNEIIEICLDKEAVKTLAIHSKKDIISKFGAPKEIDKRNDEHYYFYPERKIVIAWKEDDNELYGIYLGDNIIKITTFTAHDFLMKYYEFKAMVPDKNNWNEKSLRSNLPRYYRLLALKSLMKAFNIGEDLLEDFEKLGFIDRRDASDFEPLYQDVEAYIEQNDFEKKRFEGKIKMKKLRDYEVRVKMIVRKLLRFTNLLRETLNFNSGWLETGMINSRYLIHKTSQLLHTIDTNKLNEIEDLIVLVIDPQEQSFTKGELIRKYNYPDIDLLKIDLESY